MSDPAGNARRSSGFAAGLVVGAVLGLILAALLALAAGLIAGEPDDGPVAEARGVIEENYFRPVNDEQLDQASIRGMIDTLRKRNDDRFSHYFDPEQYDRFESATSGKFDGVGLAVNEVKRGLSVADVYPDTPAERAGIEVGDVITAVDGRSIAGVPSDISTARIKGPPGSEVELQVDPARKGPAREVTVERASVRIPAVTGRIVRAGGRPIAYVGLKTFSQGAHGELREEIERLRRRGARALVLDLRGNGGGLLNEAVLTASVFVEDGEIVSTESRTQGNRTYDAVGEALDPQPAVVLANRDTASAAEILAAALKAYDLATIVGTRTYGKGTFQEVIELPTGGALDLTVGEYLTADGTSLAGEGIRPDVHAADDPDTGRPFTPHGDEALRRALRVLADRRRP